MAEWWTRAACDGEDPEMWTVASTSDRRGLMGNEVAKRICARCPVRVECAADADRYGSWGVIVAGEARHKPPTLPPPPLRLCARLMCRQPFEPRTSNQMFCPADHAQEVRRVKVATS